MSWRSMTYRILWRLKFSVPFIQKIRHHSTGFGKKIFTTKCQLFTGYHLALTTLLNQPEVVDEEIKNTLEKGGAAILEMMDQLTDLLVKASKEYRGCLAKQIEITLRATEVGPLSEVWDELPEYRTLADQLNNQLNEYISIFKVIGEITYDTTMVATLTGNTSDRKEIDAIGKRFKELEVLILSEFEENKKKEIELLKATRNSILLGKG